ncbi:hypothetical protein pEaSNUABM14_00081 [Erwinia phage pEa_SNUABM_14]|uniref:Uncharacterized protein n=1 Tax=Erwinia phage pEa_SNUABM_7 TaxID=2866695 RepID=A0AAE8BKK8_9CAUD|nr:hypothetical protein MPK74_gp082 [Erwinia phage pEa_SNUABM_7]QYW03041.1 hypothetical protein pEaSNUABM13_00082 [Erwinia phage pEa_SNUABM_13]QYW03382.1 hypothetical protein pEaSNUABM34_00080 [Erwinia phage pEa_SNUABM_34]QYW03724.1 hypothetical protein pEaSNUABM45_00081 [Erwinia phage pEa_SNUABM_45]QYW04065.1 hypothetical protein pEaSNUABM46_00081 [Erwinia phage pEa_SNUABM_46]QYW04406.1 hypothetical protein pEaSNUABM14_00081 [Erwinia phage pEa_SNUABM_14]QYW05095.1 hypothetical protein pEaSNU
MEHLSYTDIFAFTCTYIGGVLMNYIVKTRREHLGWKEYWTLNPVASIAALCVSTGMMISLIRSGQTDHLTYFSLAFTVENLINTQISKSKKEDADGQNTDQNDNNQ